MKLEESAQVNLITERDTWKRTKKIDDGCGSNNSQLNSDNIGIHAGKHSKCSPATSSITFSSLLIICKRLTRNLTTFELEICLLLKMHLEFQTVKKFA